MGTGYGLTAVGTRIGALADPKSLNGGSVLMNTELQKALSDADRCGEHVPIDIEGKDVTVVFKWNKTLYNTLQAECVARTSDTYTFTDAEGNTLIGLAYVVDPGDRNQGPQLEEITAVFRPKTRFVFTPAA